MGEYQGLIVRHPVFRMLPASARDFALHSRLIASKKCKVIATDQHFRNFKVTIRGPLQHIRGLRETVQEKIMLGESVWV